MGNQAVIDAVKRTLADTYIVFTKTQNYHWNVEGPEFRDLHKLTEEQYEELFGAIDILGEKVRTLGAYTPGTLAEFLELSVIQEKKAPLSARDMIQDLHDSHVTLVNRLKEGIKIADDHEDPATEDLLTERLRDHSMTIWMLSAILNGHSVAESKTKV